MKIAHISVLACALAFATPLAAQDKKATPAKASQNNMQVLAKQIKDDKKVVVAHNMHLTEAEGEKFWPLYDGYQKALNGIYKRTGRVVTAYADAYTKDTFNDELAKKLMTEMLAIEGAEARLRRTYAEKVTQAISATAAARFLQIENKVRAMVNYEFAAGIPLVP